MSIKAIFLDFYGTLVHEDDDIIPLICKEIQQNASEECEINDIGRYWWQQFSHMFRNSYGDTFKPQRELGMLSLQETITRFQSKCDAKELIQLQFDHWCKPQLYEDTLAFLEDHRRYQVYILSNIDSADVRAAASYHGIKVDEIYTSEDVKSYKPRPELFLEAMNRNNLTANEIIHIGDSYASDVGGAGNLGIKAIWLNRLHKNQPLGGLEPTYICNNLLEAKEVINEVK